MNYFLIDFPGFFTSLGSDDKTPFEDFDMQNINSSLEKEESEVCQFSSNPKTRFVANNYTGWCDLNVSLASAGLLESN